MQLQPDQEHTHSAIICKSLQGGLYSTGCWMVQATSVAQQYFTEWYTTHGTEFSRWWLVVLCVCVCVCSCVCALTFFRSLPRIIYPNSWLKRRCISHPLKKEIRETEGRGKSDWLVWLLPIWKILLLKKKKQKQPRDQYLAHGAFGMWDTRVGVPPFISEG